jgi:hypothetical protein
MTGPHRLLDDPAELTELESRVLTAGSEAEPGLSLKQQLWSALSAKLPPPGGAPSGGDSGGGAGAPAAGAAGAAGGPEGAASAGAVGGKALAISSIVKATAIGVSLGFVATTAAFTLEPDRSAADPAPAAAPAPAKPLADTTGIAPAAERKAATPAPAAGPTPGAPGRDFEQAATRISEPSMAERTAETAAARAAPETSSERAAPTPGAPAAASVARFDVAGSPMAAAPVAPLPSASQAAEQPVKSGRSTSAREESRLVAAARDALRSGNAGRALSLLDQARRQFPRGTLAQEREALGIEALAASGQRAAAAERARRFLSAHPSSMHAARVRSFARLP